MKQITDVIDQFPFSVLAAYYTILGVCCFAFLTPVDANIQPSHHLKQAAEYVKEWKCPYCHHHWKYGEKCKNEECASTQW